MTTLEMDAVWAGPPTETPPATLDSAIVFAPAGWVAVEALKKLDKNGRLVLAGIYMSPIENLSYDLLRLEREVKSVANVTRRDVRELLKEAARVGVKPRVRVYRLDEANLALRDLKYGRVTGSLVLRV